MVQATGGRDMVRAAYSSGTPAYGVGAGQLDDGHRRDRRRGRGRAQHPAQQDVRLRLGLLGRRQPDRRVHHLRRAARLPGRRGRLISSPPDEAAKLRAVLWDDEGHRTPDTIAISAQALAAKAGFEVASDRRFLMVEQTEIGRAQPVQLGEARRGAVDVPLLRLRRGARQGARRSTRSAARATRAASTRSTTTTSTAWPRIAPVSRIMVRQPQSKANAGSFNNGMPMTSSLGCGTWGGNITSENIHLKHYMNVTWVSRPIAGGPPIGAGALRRVLRDRRSD